jgi:hypothetical protein
MAASDDRRSEKAVGHTLKLDDRSPYRLRFRRKPPNIRLLAMRTAVGFMPARTETINESTCVFCIFFIRFSSHR